MRRWKKLFSKISNVDLTNINYNYFLSTMNVSTQLQFLRIHGSSAQRRYNPPIFRNRVSSSVSNDSAMLGSSELLDMCKQVASGMAYLESHHAIILLFQSDEYLPSQGLKENSQSGQSGSLSSTRSCVHVHVSGNIYQLACSPVVYMCMCQATYIS